MGGRLQGKGFESGRDFASARMFAGRVIGTLVSVVGMCEIWFILIPVGASTILGLRDMTEIRFGWYFD